MSATQDGLSLSGGGLRCRLDEKTGQIVELLHEAEGNSFVAADTLPGGLEAYDELDRRWYTDLHGKSTLTDVRRGKEEIAFVKRFVGAPFELRCTWRADKDGLHLDVDTALLPDQPMRSVRITLVVPATPELVSWAPSHPDPADVRSNPVRYCYLADERGKARTGIPMLTLWHPRRGALSMVVPFDVPKVQLNMGVEPQDPTKWYVPEHIPRINAGAEVDTVTPPEKQQLGDDPVIRFTEKHVGLRPGRPLRFAMWLFAHQPDWRPGMGRVVERYRDYFEPHPNAIKHAGGRFRANPSAVAPEQIVAVKDFAMTHAWFHGHFEFHGEFLTDEAMSDPDYRWLCEPYPDQFHDLSVEQIRGQVKMLKDAGIGTFLYGFNMHCDETIIEKRKLQPDVARNEDGQIARAYHEQPVMFFNPDSPFGRQQLDQMDRMIKAYPEIMGVALDNWNYAGIDFGHDDGVTMVNSKPAANINFSQQRMIRAIADKMHRSGRMVCTNKGRTIESFRGVDFVLTEARGAETYATFAYMNVFRTVAPAEYRAGDDAQYAEYVIKYLLIWSGQLSSMECQVDPAQARAYQPLLALMRNCRWVFEPDPLTLPAETKGQIFRIDPRSPFNPDSVVVTVVRPDVSWRDGDLKPSLQVAIRLSDMERFKRAEWLGVDRSDQSPVACSIGRENGRLTIDLPPMGSAGVLKLSSER